MNKNLETIKYKTDDIELDVNYSPEDGNVWLSNKDICFLFNKNKSAISRHIKKALESINSVVAKNETVATKFETTGADGKRYKVNYYSLDIVLAIGDNIGSDRSLLLKQFLDDYLKQEVIDNKQNIIIYNNGNVKLDVKISPEEDTVWLNVNQIAELFDKDRTVIIKHIDNIYEEGELIPVSTCAKNAQVQIEGDRKVTRVVEYYNLDMILAVGYRTSGKRAIEFRKWASSVLKRYLLKGYAIDNTRVTVTAENFVQLENDISDLKNRMSVVEKQVLKEPIQVKIFSSRKYFDAYTFICSLLESAKESALIVDPYFDIEGLKTLAKVSPNVSKTICISPKAKLTEKDIDEYRKQYGDIFVVTNDLFHDRFIVIDNSACYSIGASINYVGKRIFGVFMFKNKDDIKTLI